MGSYSFPYLVLVLGRNTISCARECLAVNAKGKSCLLSDLSDSNLTTATVKCCAHYTLEYLGEDVRGLVAVD